jgi:two-component system sensor histidine kinase BarA
MHQWGIKQQVVFLALIPALLISLVLSIYFSYSQLTSISNTLKRHGETVTNQVALSSEYAVFSGNIQSLRTSINRALENDKEVVRITVSNASNTVLISVSDNPEPKKYPAIFYEIFGSDQLLGFRKEILTEEVLIDDFDDNRMLSNTDKNTQDKTIGFVELSLTTQYSNEQKIMSLVRAGIITLGILLISAFIAFRYSRKIAQPVQDLTEAVKDIAAGNYDTNIQQDAPGELAILESCVNMMANELLLAQTDMESRINEFTNELQETLEELEIRNAELDITRSNAMQASKSKSEFLANMSHEIRTPLSGILGFTELLINTDLNNQQMDYALTVQKSANNLLTIIDDILDLSKIESGKLDITPVNFNIIDIIEDVIDLLAPIAYEKNVELFYHVENDVPCTVESDPVRIRQILINLVGNAVKFTEKGYVFLHIESDNENSTYGVKFTVADTGIGMDQKGKQKLFTAFTQADTSITRKFGGTGLGLVISRKLVLLMKGEIGFDSTIGEGSTFWFSIPVKVINDAMSKRIPELSGTHIALIEEQVLCRRALKSMLEQWGCIVTEYSLERCLNDNQLTTLDSIDALVIGISRKELPDIDEYFSLVKQQIVTPVMTLVSTRSYTELDLLSNKRLGSLVFRTARLPTIQKALANTINSTAPDLLKPASNKEIHNGSQIPQLKALVVDDNEINLRLAEIILTKNGVNVTTALSGEDSIELIKNNNYHLIFMDLHMPGLDGYETSRRLRELESNDHHSVIIALTANAMPQEVEKIATCGMDDILIKPISEQLLIDIIKRWFSGTSVNMEDSTHVSNEPESSDIFSLDEAIRLTNGNEKVALELFHMLINELPQHREAIIQAYQQSDRSLLKELTHKLNGASRCCGTPALRKAADKLEVLIDNNDEDSLESGKNSLLDEIDRLLDYELPPNLLSQEQP